MTHTSGGHASRRAFVAAIGVAALGVLGVVAQAEPTPRVTDAVPCVRAGLVDGRLACGDELPADRAALCGTSPSANTEAIVSGDAIVTAQVCARRTAEPSEEGPRDRSRAAGWGRMAPSQLAALGLPVNLNTASERELTSLPRIGPTLARRIAQGRPYRTVEQLIEVRGIGPVTLQRLRSRVVVTEIDPP